jgi:hypothetical protein
MRRVGGELVLGRLVRNELFEFGHDLFFKGADEAGIDGLVDFEKWQAIKAVDPVVGGGAEAKSLAGDVMAGQLGEVAVIDAGVAVDVEGGGGGGIDDHPVFAKFGGPCFSVALGGEDFDFFARKHPSDRRLNKLDLLNGNGLGSQSQAACVLPDFIAGCDSRCVAAQFAGSRASSSFGRVTGRHSMISLRYACGSTP